MNSARVNLKCNAGKTLPSSYFQFPHGKNPGDFEPVGEAEVTYLKEGTLAHTVFIHVLPTIMGVIILIFFLISSGFIVYGIIRHVYTDHMLPRKTRTVRKLGKHIEVKRRKKYRTRARSEYTGSSGVDAKSKSSKSIGSSSKFSSRNSRSYGSSMRGSQLLRTEETPYYMDDLLDEMENDKVLSRGVSEMPLPEHIISYTSPPMIDNKNPPLPTISKIIEMPGQFPKLPDVPTNLPKPKTTEKVAPLIPVRLPDINIQMKNVPAQDKVRIIQSQPIEIQIRKLSPPIQILRPFPPRQIIEQQEPKADATYPPVPPALLKSPGPRKPSTKIRPEKADQSAWRIATGISFPSMQPLPRLAWESSYNRPKDSALDSAKTDLERLLARREQLRSRVADSSRRESMDKRQSTSVETGQLSSETKRRSQDPNDPSRRKRRTKDSVKSSRGSKDTSHRKRSSSNSKGKKHSNK